MVRGHPGHLLRPAERGPRLAHDRRRDGRAARGLRRRALRRGHRRPALDQGDDRARTCAHVTARVDPRTGWVVALCALDNLVKGASGQAIQCANAALGLPETTGLPGRGDLPVSVTAPEGFVAAGGSGGIKAERRARRGPRGHGRRPGRPGGRRVHLQPGRGGAGPGQPGPPRRHRRARGRGRDPHVGQRQRGHRRPGARRRDAALRRGGVGHRRRAPRRSSSARPGSSASRSRSTSSSRISAAIVAARDAEPRGGGPGGAGDHDDRHRAQGGGRSRATASPSGGMAKGAAMLAPEHGHHARRLHDRRRRGRRHAAGRALAQAVADSFNTITVDGCTSTNDTVLVLASGVGGPPVGRTT